MEYDPQKHHRRSVRLKGYDYSQSGWYFITICIKNRESLFGKIENARMKLNEFGKIADAEWEKTLAIRNNILLDEYVLMPNHLHAIIGIVNHLDSDVGAYRNTPLQNQFQSPSKSIGAIIRGYKSSVTKQINILRNAQGKSIWQRNYYDHIIRDEQELNQIRQYIINNPAQWQDDKYYEG